MPYVDTVITVEESPKAMQERIAGLVANGYTLHFVEKTVWTESNFSNTSYRSFLSDSGFLAELRTKHFCNLPNEQYELFENYMSSYSIAKFLKYDSVLRTHVEGETDRQSARHDQR